MIAKACIFDFDGVIVDSEKYHHEAWEQVAKQMGTDFSYEEYKPYKSAGRAAVIPYLLNKAGLKPTPKALEFYTQLRGVYVEKALSKLNENDITPGIRGYLKLLKDSGIATAVASSSSAAHITAKRFGLFDLFDAFVDGSAKLPNKPKPDLFLHAAKLLNASADECVVFEDSINGLKAAHAAKMHCVGIQTYFCDLADKIIDDFSKANLTLIDF